MVDSFFAREAVITPNRAGLRALGFRVWGTIENILELVPLLQGYWILCSSEVPYSL